MPRTPALVLGTVAGLLAATAPAVAGGDPDIRRLTVRYDDLDLSTGAGRDRLDGRLRRAAARVCDNGSPPRIDEAAMQCRARALRDARTEIAALMPAMRVAMRD